MRNRVATALRKESHELLVDERTGEIVVAALERAYTPERIRIAQDDHWTVTDAAAIERVRVAQHQDVRVRGARKIIGVAEREHVEAVARQLTREETANGRFGFGEQQGSHSTNVATRMRAHQMSIRARV